MKISWAAWHRAFREASPHQSSWINIKTGEVKRFNPKKLGEERVAALEEELYDDDAWVEIPFAESDDEYEDMRTFSVSPGAGKGARDLLMALADPKPFRRFRDALRKHPDAGEAWNDNRWLEAELRLVAFCQAYGIAKTHPKYLERVAELDALQDAADAEAEAATN